MLDDIVTRLNAVLFVTLFVILARVPFPVLSFDRLSPPEWTVGTSIESVQWLLDFACAAVTRGELWGVPVGFGRSERLYLTPESPERLPQGLWLILSTYRIKVTA